MMALVSSSKSDQPRQTLFMAADLHAHYGMHRFVGASLELPYLPMRCSAV
jgi:hypothetical protein